MQRIGSLFMSQMLVILFVGSSYAWPHPDSPREDYDAKKPMSAFGTYKRLPSYDFGLGKRETYAGSIEEPSSYEDLYSPDSYNYNALDKRAQPNMFSFGLGRKRSNRVYGFGLGRKRNGADELEQAWKNPSASALNPSYRPERRSKIYSFGLGKRSGTNDAGQPWKMAPGTYSLSRLGNGDSYDEDDQLPEKRANSGRQFSFGLGKKRDVDSTQLVKNSTP